MSEPAPETEAAERDRKTRAVARDHACRIGEVALAWGYFHVNLALWYTTFTSPTADITEAFRRWDKVPSDYGQREMLVKALIEKRAKNPDAIDSIVWVCEWANELARIRNAFIHLAVVIRGLPDNPQVAFTEQLHLGNEDRFKHVKEKPDQSYEALMADLMALSEFTHRTFNAVVLPAQFGPSPARPELAIQKLFPDHKPNPFA